LRTTFIHTAIYMRLRYAEIFHAVMQAGTVHGAAKLLHITQPAASRLLQQAENNVGVPLFSRERGRLLPTLEARKLYPEVERLYLQLDAVRKVAASLSRPFDAALRVLCVPALGLGVLPSALSQWAKDFPQVQVELTSMHSQQVMEALALHQGDIGFLFEPATHPGMHSELLAQGEVVCIGPDLPAHPVTLRELAERPLIDLDATKAIKNLLSEAQLVGQRAQVTVPSYHTAVELSAQGFGWALMDSFSAHYVRRHTHLRVRPLHPQVPFPVFAAWLRNEPTSVPTDALRTHVCEELQRILQTMRCDVEQA
jgi:DNA-binding transcriptional LysR family regulator